MGKSQMLIAVGSRNLPEMQVVVNRQKLSNGLISGRLIQVMAQRAFIEVPIQSKNFFHNSNIRL